MIGAYRWSRRNRHWRQREEQTLQPENLRRTWCSWQNRCKGNYGAWWSSCSGPIVNADGPTLKGLINGYVSKGPIVYTDRGYRGLSGFNPYSVNHGVGEYVRKQAQPNGIESFWALLNVATTEFTITWALNIYTSMWMSFLSATIPLIATLVHPGIN